MWPSTSMIGYLLFKLQTNKFYRLCVQWYQLLFSVNTEVCSKTITIAGNFKITIYSINLPLQIFDVYKLSQCQSQWQRGLRRRSAATRLLRLWVRIPPVAWMFVCCECCVLSGRGLCNELITCPEESYRLWCVIVCDLETSRMRRPWPTLGRSATVLKKK
jgi:hypothetical protein